MIHCELERRDEVVDEQAVVLDGPAAEHREAPTRHPLKQHSEPTRIARAVNGTWPQDYGVESAFREPSHLELPEPLRLLVVIGGRYRSILVRRRIPYVPVDAACAAMNELAGPMTLGRLEHDARARNVDLVVMLVGLADLGGEYGDALGFGALGEIGPERPQDRVGHLGLTVADVLFGDRDRHPKSKLLARRPRLGGTGGKVDDLLECGFGTREVSALQPVFGLLKF